MSFTLPSAGKVLIKDIARKTVPGFILGIRQNLLTSTEETFNAAGPCVSGPFPIICSCKNHHASSLPDLTSPNTVLQTVNAQHRTDISFSPSTYHQPHPCTDLIFLSCPINFKVDRAQRIQSVDFLSL